MDEQVGQILTLLRTGIHKTQLKLNHNTGPTTNTNCLRGSKPRMYFPCRNGRVFLDEWKMYSCGNQIFRSGSSSRTRKACQVSHVTVTKKVSKSNNLLPLAFTSILILVTCYLKPDTYYPILVTLHLIQVHVTWYFYPLFVTLFFSNVINLKLVSRYMFADNLYLIPPTVYLLPNNYNLILVT